MDSSVYWRLGWALGAGVVVLAAGLLLTIIGLARRIADQAGQIEGAIDGARRHSVPLFDVAVLNQTLERVTRGVRARGEAA